MPRERRAARAGRGVLLASCAYVLGGLIVLWPFNRALADFRTWYAKDAGLTMGMSRQDVSEVFAKHGRFTVQPDGDWVVYDLEPGGLAGLHPLLGFADVDLYRVRVRCDPQTRLAIEITRL